MERLVVTVNLVVEATEGEEIGVEKSVRGLIQQMIENDEPPHRVVDFGIEEVQTERAWKEKALAGD